MKYENNILKPSDDNNYLYNDDLQIPAKEVRLGSVGHIADWREVTPVETEDTK